MSPSLFTRITAFLSQGSYGSIRFEIDKSYRFNLWLKAFFVAGITLLILKNLIIEAIFADHKISITQVISEANFILIWKYTLYTFLLGVIFYLNYVNLQNRILRIFLPFVFYILIEIFTDFLQFLIPDNFDISWFYTFSDQNNGSATSFIFSHLFLRPILTIGAVIIFFIVEKTQIRRIYQLLKRRPMFVLFYCFLTIILLLLFFQSDNSDIVFRTSTSISENESKIQNHLQNTTIFGRAFYMISIILIFTIWEELIYRYAIQKIFANQNNQGFVFYILVSTTLFALGHISYSEIGPSSGVFDFFHNIFAGPAGTNFSYWYMSYIITLIYFFGGYNLFYVIIVHVFNNFVISL